MGNADKSRYSAALAMDYGIMVLCTKIHDQANIIHILLVYVCKSHNANLKDPLNASSTTTRILKLFMFLDHFYVSRQFILKWVRGPHSFG